MGYFALLMPKLPLFYTLVNGCFVLPCGAWCNFAKADFSLSGESMYGGSGFPALSWGAQVEKMAGLRDVKMRMAREVVTEFHSAAAREAEEAFIRQFQRRQLPEQIPDYVLAQPMLIVTLLTEAGLATSRSHARDLVQQGGVPLYLDGEGSEAERVRAPGFVVQPRDGIMLQVGKLQFRRLRVP
jgi:tyrosyl-tRNA synthetase